MKDVGKSGRVLGSLGLGLVFMTLAALLMLVVGILLTARLPAWGPGQWAVVGLFLLGLALATSGTGWLLVRVNRDRPATGGGLAIPVRFIQGFGALMLASAVAAALMGIIPTRYAAASAVLALQMITLPRLIRPVAARADPAGPAPAPNDPSTG